jgi:2-ketoarginine methyltransferase
VTATPQDKLFTSTEGYFVSKTLLALWRLGVLDHATAGGGLEAGKYAAEQGWDAGLLRSILGYLVIRGYFEVEGDSFRLTEHGRSIAPHFGYLPMHIGAYEPVLEALEDLISGQRVYGTDVKRSEIEMLGGMTALEEHMLDRLADMTDGAAFSKVLDLGCGSAHLLAKLLRRFPAVHGVGIDLETDAVEDARRNLAEAGLGGRTTILRGDASRFGDLPAGALDGVDLVIAMFVMHEIYRQCSGSGVIECLRNIAGLLGPQGRLLMVEVARIDPVAPRPGLRFVPEYQLLHDFSNQRLASQDDWCDMLAEAGMTVVRTEPAGLCQAFCFVARPVAASS